MQVDSSLNFVTDNIMLTDTSTYLDSAQIVYTPSSFISESSPTSLSFPIREKNNGDWVTLLLLLGFILLAISKFIFRKRFSDLFKSLWARNYSNQLMRDGNVFREQFGLTMFGLYIVSIPLFYSLSTIFLFPEYKFTLSILIVIQYTALSIILWSYRILFIKTTAFIFKTPKQSDEILTQLFIFNLLSGVAVLPFITLFYYSEMPIFLILGIAIWCFMQIYRFVRLFVVGFSYSIFSGLHLFLYLCTLEIVPIIILVKVVCNFLKL